MQTGQSNVRFKDYRSVYVPMGVEVAETLRKRYDDNKHNHDLIDRFLGSFESSDGDKINVDLAGKEVKDMLGQVINSGQYERAGAVIADAQTYLETNKGLLLAKQSMDVRKREMEWMEGEKRKGRVLDFGAGKFKNHVSYYVADDGTEHENVYVGDSQAMMDYPAAMRNLLVGIKADWNGITQNKADGIARELTTA